MNQFQHKLRWIIATGSAVGFLSGWALLSHAGKPVATGALATLTAQSASQPAAQIETITLPPIDFSALEVQGSVQPITIQPSFQSFGRARLRTGGS